MSRFVPSADMQEVVEAASIEGRLEVAEQVVERAALHSRYSTGAYRKSLQAVEDDGDVRAESSDPFAHLNEWGSINNPAYAPLRSAGADVGRFEPA